jgi:hypothetical protein
MAAATNAEVFLISLGIDDAGAREAFVGAPLAIQEAVMEADNIFSANDPCAALLARIDAEKFIGANSLDERAANALRGCAPKVQQVAMGKGNLKGCTNPSAAMLGCIRDATETVARGRVSAVAQGDGPLVEPGEVDKFLNEHPDLDERARGALHNCPPQVQRIVLDLGVLAQTSNRSFNVSACLLGRIRQAQRAAAGGPGKGTMHGKGSAGMGKGQGKFSGGAGQWQGQDDPNSQNYMMGTMMMGMMSMMMKNMQGKSGGAARHSPY